MRLLNNLWWFVFLGVLFGVVGFVERENHLPTKGEIVVQVDRTDGNSFIDESEIITMFNNTSSTLTGTSWHYRNVGYMEEKLDNHPHIRNAEVYMDVEGMIRVDIEQRLPILRVLNQQGGSFYIDYQGNPMPTSDQYTARVPVANGNISLRPVQWGSMDSTSRTWMERLHKLSKFLYEDDFWHAHIAQVYVNEQQEIEMIPNVGEHVILLGDVDQLEQKMNKLRTFYQQGLSYSGWNKYEQINLKFKEQVVGKKK